MNWRTIKEMRFELEERGYFVESVNDEYFVISNLKDNDDKMYYVYEGVFETDGKLKIFNSNFKK